MTINFKGDFPVSDDSLKAGNYIFRTVYILFGKLNYRFCIFGFFKTYIMKFPLTASIKLDLSNLHKGSKQKYIADRVKSIQLIGNGYAQKQIAEILGVSEKTLYNWRQEFLNAKDIYEFASPKANQYQGKLDDEKKTSL